MSSTVAVESTSEVQKPPPVKSETKLPPVVIRQELLTLIGTVKEIELITTVENVLEGLGEYIRENKLFDERNPSKVYCKNDALGSILGLEEFILTDVDLKCLLRKVVMPVSKHCKDSADGATIHSNNPLKRKLDEGLEHDHRKLAAVDVQSSPAKCSSPMVIYIPPSPKYIDESDSVDSLQGYETAYVKDTSDELLSSLEDDDNEEPIKERIFAIHQMYNLEYDVESDSSSPTLYADSSDSDDPVNPESMMLLGASVMALFSKPESDIEFFADDDSSDKDSEDDKEITESDFWTCKNCKVANKPPMRYCLRCFNERVNWLPDNAPKFERKKRKSGRKNRRKNKNEASSSKSICGSQRSESSTTSCETKENSSDLSATKAEPLVSSSMESSDLPSSQSSQLSHIEMTSYIDTTYMSPINDLSLPNTNSLPSSTSPYFQPASSFIVEPTASSVMDSSLCSMEPVSSLCMKSISCYFNGPAESSSSGQSSTSLEPSLASSQSSSSECLSLSSFNPKPSCSSVEEPGAKLCLICCTEPANACIIHGKYAHQVTCYKCGRKLKKQRKGCPICRTPIERVVHHINNL